MSSRDLVGRPLVPFFDAEENVNAALEVDASAGGHEQIEVDARVWNKELGYFEYPSEASAGGSSSTPIAIPAKGRKPSADAGKTLLTPAMMLSTSCPEASTMTQNSHNVSSTSVPVGDGNPARSSSTKRGSKQQKGRSATPNARSQGKQNVHVTGPLGINGKNESGSDSSANSSGGKKSRRKGSGNGKGQNGSAQQKPKEELSASGKWAWSAFQSSPDPNQLPLPPFLAKPVSGAAQTTTITPPPPPQPDIPSARAPDATPREHAQAQVPRPIPPFQPPLPPTPPPPEAPMSIELSMTQDLRRMLNIGGG